MKFIVDAQLPPALAHWLNDAGHEAVHVQDTGLCNADDSSIWQFASEQRAVIVTKDEDFAARARQTASGPTILWLRIGNCSRRALLSWFAPLLPAILREIEQGQRLIEVR